MRMRTMAPLVVLVQLLAGCELGTTSTNTDLSVSKIEITPGNLSVTTGAYVDDPVQFSATVYWSTGEVLENADVAWQSSNQIAGTMTEEGLFTPSAENGGTTLITASYLGKTGSTTLTVVYTQDIIEDDLPASLPELADTATVAVDDAQAPFVMYPYDGVVVPRNITDFEFQWTPVEGRPVTILEFSSATTHTRVFTRADRWSPDPTTWQRLAAANTGGSFSLSARSAVLTGEGEDTALEGDILAPSESIDVSISRLDAVGAIYYWSLHYETTNDTSASGLIMRTGAEEGGSSVFFAPEDSNGDPICVSCHAISPNGEEMTMVYDSSQGHRVGLLS